MKIYVNQQADSNGNGTKEHPFDRINKAAGIARPGDEVIVAPGIYREYINPANAGTEYSRIIYKSAEPKKAVITGAEILKDWTLYQGTTWVARVKNDLFQDYNPYTELVEGDWYMGEKLHTGEVFLNDRAMYESQTLEECVEGNYFQPSWEPEYAGFRWYTEQDGDETVIYANFRGADPNKENVEFTVRRRCIFPLEEGRNYLTFQGFVVTKAATTWAPPSCHQDGMIGVNWSKGWVIEDCEISNSKCCGVSLGRHYDPDNEQFFFNHQVKSANQMGRESICRALAHGWYKDLVGSHVVSRCDIHHCGQAGIVGRQGCIFSTIEDNHIHDIGVMQQVIGAENAGIKLHVPIDVVMRRNHIHHCIMGIWCDWVAQGTRITENFLHDNQVPDGIVATEFGKMSQDIFIEASLGPTLLDNNVLMSKVSVRLAGQGVACVHNLFCGSFTSVGGGTDQMVNGVNQPRYFSYHFPHRTELIGFMSCLHGDNRFFNNIFIQRWPVSKQDGGAENMGFLTKSNEQVGTFVWDEYPDEKTWLNQFDFSKKPTMGDMIKMSEIHFAHLPVWIAGNAYFNAAKGWAKELGALHSEKQVQIDVKEENGSYYLATNLGECFGEFTCSEIRGNDLGKAFEPDQKFENPDGTEIIFDKDYSGKPRKNIIPGPFAEIYKKIPMA